MPFSIHNYNDHVTPSPYVPFPNAAQRAVSEKRPGVDGNGAVTNGTQGDAPQAETHRQTKEGAATAKSAADARQLPKQEKVFVRVLHPTALSRYTEMNLYRSSSDSLPPLSRRGSAVSTPTSATIPNPSNSAAPPSTPVNANGPPAKKQKTSASTMSPDDFESAMVAFTAPQLYLEPAKSYSDMRRIMNALRNPRHEGQPPPPKRRKRTVAELAADEAIAADQERFMLVLDQRIGSAASGAAKTSTVDGEADTAAFTPDFARFKALESIKLRQEEMKKEKAAAVELGKRRQQEQLERDKVDKDRRREIDERLRADQHRHHHRQQATAKTGLTPQQQQPQPQPTQQQPHTTPHATPNNVMPNPHPLHLQPSSQQPTSSPVPHHNTLQSSPTISYGMPGQVGGVPMEGTPSNHGAGSPPRPSSAVQSHMAATMVHSISQRSHQGPSRNGTPHNAHLTPSIQHATPVMRHLTPTPRISHASPVPTSMSVTPVMHNSGPASTPQIPGSHLTPQQRSLLLHHQHQQQQKQAAQHQQQHPVLQPMHINGQPLTPQQIAALQAHHLQIQQQRQAAAQHQQQQELQQRLQQHHQQQPTSYYNASLARHIQQQMANNAAQAHQQQQHQQQQQQPNTSAASGGGMPVAGGPAVATNMAPSAAQLRQMHQMPRGPAPVPSAPVIAHMAPHLQREYLERLAAQPNGRNLLASLSNSLAGGNGYGGGGGGGGGGMPTTHQQMWQQMRQQLAASGMTQQQQQMMLQQWLHQQQQQHQQHQHQQHALQMANGAGGGAPTAAAVLQGVNGMGAAGPGPQQGRGMNGMG